MTTKGTGAGKPPPASPVECEVAAHSRLMRQWQEPDANIRHLDALISSAEGGWRRTRNPLFVWWALAFAGYCKPPRPIPEWSADYLRSSGNSMIALLVGEPKPATLGALKKVLPRALGITRDGHNAFASFRAWIEQAIEAEDFDAAIKAGATTEQATARAREGKHVISEEGTRKRRTRGRKANRTI